MTIRALSKEEWELAFPVMRELRTHLDLDTFLELVGEAARSDQYKLVVIEEEKEVVAVMGYRLLTDLVHGRHLYIDDLVTTKFKRSYGYGAHLLKYAESQAQIEACSGLRLSTGVENEAGKRFYERENWHLRAVVYKKRCPVTIVATAHERR